MRGFGFIAFGPVYPIFVGINKRGFVVVVSSFLSGIDTKGPEFGTDVAF